MSAQLASETLRPRRRMRLISFENLDAPVQKGRLLVMAPAPDATLAA